MNKSLKIGLALFLIGLGVVLSVNIATKGELFDVNEGEFELHEESYTKEQFESFTFDFDNRDIYVLPSEEENISIKFYVNEKEDFEYNDETDELSITIDYQWQRNIFSFSFPKNRTYYKVYLYVPASFFAYNFDFTSKNGYIKVEDILLLGDVDLKTSNGDLEITNSSVNQISMNTSNGKLNLANISVTGDLEGRTSNGRVNATNIEASKIELRTSNGRIIAEDLNSKYIKLNTSNGEIDSTVIGNKDDFHVRIHTSNGSRYYDGIKVAQSDFNTSKVDYVELTSSNGNVTLNFKD